MPMTSRERVLAVLNHEIPDRVPIVVGVSNATGMKMRPYQGLKRSCSASTRRMTYLYDWPELGSAKIDEETMRRLGTRCARGAGQVSRFRTRAQ